MSEHNNTERELEQYEKVQHERMNRSDPVSNFAWAAILIWAGLVFLARNLGWFRNLPGDMGVWSVIFIGGGLIILLEALVRLLILKQPRPVKSSLFLGLVFIGIGFGSLFGWSIVWPFILIAIGLSILVKNVWSRD
jgi:hypothetical protein